MKEFYIRHPKIKYYRYMVVFLYLFLFLAGVMWVKNVETFEESRVLIFHLSLGGIVAGYFSTIFLKTFEYKIKFNKIYKKSLFLKGKIIDSSELLKQTNHEFNFFEDDSVISFKEFNLKNGLVHISENKLNLPLVYQPVITFFVGTSSFLGLITGHYFWKLF